ncbi:hypothetical protein WMF30_40280 [Sorangium sp. So ce134]
MGDKVRCILFIRNMGINELDRLLGKGGYTTRIVRNERTPRYDTAAQLADALRVPSWWLFAGVDSPQGPKRAEWDGLMLKHIDDAQAAFAEVRTKISADAADAYLHFYIGEFTEPDYGSKEPKIMLATCLFAHVTLRQIAPKWHGLTIEQCLEIAERHIEKNSPKFGNFLTAATLIEFLTPMPSKQSRTAPEASKAANLTLRDLPEWDRALEDAQNLYPSASKASFAVVARAPAPSDMYVDAQLVGELARSYHEAGIRARSAKKK